MNNKLGIALALILGFLLWQQEQMRRELQGLRATLTAAHLPVQTGSPAEPRINDRELAQLQREMAKLQMEMVQAAGAPPQQKPVASPVIESAVDAETQRSFSPVIDNTLALGVLDGRAWAEMEADVTKMSKEENRAFWMQVFGGIERGELQVVPPDENSQ